MDIDLKIDELLEKHNNVEIGLSCDEDSFFLESIYVEQSKRKKGYASAFLKDLCDLADECQMYIDLSPSSDSDNNFENDETFLKLTQFYEKFGFALTSIQDGYMSRSYVEKNNLKI